MRSIKAIYTLSVACLLACTILVCALAISPHQTVRYSSGTETHIMYWLKLDFSTLVLMTFWTGNSLLLGAVLCTVGYLVASLASTHQMSRTTPSQLVTRKLSPALDNCHLGTKLPLVEDPRVNVIECGVLPNLSSGTTQLGVLSTLFHFSVPLFPHLPSRDYKVLTSQS